MTSSVLQALRRESLDIFNRLHSIEDDAAFVNSVHEFYPDTPLIPNLRCGAWYADPIIASRIPAYFKSTDGHFNNWSFNLRRPNLHLLPIIVKCHSMILVDSTRAGKRIPDALSKTIPIWCAVLNSAIARRYPGLRTNTWDTALYTPPGVVSAQEHHQIQQRINAWADALFNSSFDLPALPAPLRPLWITPATTTFPALPVLDTPPFLPIICLSASRQSEDARRPGGFSYIQGSGDDHELWSMGLTPSHYWHHRAKLLAASRSELPELIRMLLSSGYEPSSRTKNATKDTRVTSISKVNGRMKICTFFELESAGREDNTAYVFITATLEEPMCSTSGLQASSDHPVLKLSLTPRTKAHLAQVLLPRSLQFISIQLVDGYNVCIVCDDGGEASMEQEKVVEEGIAVLLAALTVFFDDEGKIDGSALGSGADPSEKYVEPVPGNIAIPLGIKKARIRTRLEWIIACRSSVNPARTTLKRLNEFLMSGERVI